MKRKPKHQLEENNIVVSANCSISAHREYMSLIRCPRCKEGRLSRSGYVSKQIKNEKFTGFCVSCLAKIRNQKWSDGFHPRFSGKRKTKDNYILVPIKLLRGTIQHDIAKQMSFSTGNILSVLEHRLVMAMNLKRPLLSSEIVHHKNGIRDDNRLENLELLTKERHHSGHGDVYYQKWQEVVSELQRIKSE